MPYLYTLAEGSTRTGMPMLRPLFLDFPEATRDLHPIDLDSGSEFLLGHDLLVAPAPYPDAPDDYTVEFPSSDWYDFWTGKRVPQSAPADPPPNAPPSAAAQVPLSAQVHPTLDSLPVYVRAGAIIPVQPLVQSTGDNAERAAHAAHLCRRRLPRLTLYRRWGELCVPARCVSAHGFRLLSDCQRPSDCNFKTPGQLCALVEGTAAGNLWLDAVSRHRSQGWQPGAHCH